MRPLRPPGSSAVPARVVRRPRQGRPPSSFCEHQNAGRRPHQGRSPAPPGSPAKLFEGRLGPPPGFSRWEIRRLVLRAAPPGCPPGWPAKLVVIICECQSCAVPPQSLAKRLTPPSRLDRPRLFCGVRCRPSALGRSRAPPGSSAVPARVACQGCFASARVVPRQGRPPSPPGSPAKLLLRVPERRSPPGSLAGPARVARRPRQGHPPSSLKDVSAPPDFSRWEIRVPNFTIVPHG